MYQLCLDLLECGHTIGPKYEQGAKLRQGLYLGEAGSGSRYVKCTLNRKHESQSPWAQLGENTLSVLLLDTLTCGIRQTSQGHISRLFLSNW